INLQELFYNGPRTSAGDHLSAQGWRVDVLTTTAAYEANGFEPPRDDLLAMIGDSGYLSAELEQR
ncbi:SAM-dependent methyltransferase, partial [Mycobacterium sp. ITM-2017-0098]